MFNKNRYQVYTDPWYDPHLYTCIIKPMIDDLNLRYHIRRMKLVNTFNFPLWSSGKNINLYLLLYRTCLESIHQSVNVKEMIFLINIKEQFFQIDWAPNVPPTDDNQFFMLQDGETAVFKDYFYYFNSFGDQVQMKIPDNLIFEIELSGCQIMAFVKFRDYVESFGTYFIAGFSKFLSRIMDQQPFLWIKLPGHNHSQIMKKK